MIPQDGRTFQLKLILELQRSDKRLSGFDMTRMMELGELGKARPLLALFLILVRKTSLWPQEIPIPAKTQHELFLKILEFDRNVLARTGREMIWAVIQQPSYRESQVAMDEFEQVFKAAAKQSFHELPMRICVIDYNEIQQLETRLRADSVDVLYVTPLRATKLEPILELTRKLKVLTVTGVPEYVPDSASVGINLKDNKPEILINRRSANLEGAAFSSQLLRIATLFDRE